MCPPSSLPTSPTPGRACCPHRGRGQDAVLGHRVAGFCGCRGDGLPRCNQIPEPRGRLPDGRLRGASEAPNFWQPVSSAQYDGLMFAFSWTFQSFFDPISLPSSIHTRSCPLECPLESLRLFSGPTSLPLRPPHIRICSRARLHAQRVQRPRPLRAFRSQHIGPTTLGRIQRIRLRLPLRGTPSRNAPLGPRRRLHAAP